LRVIDFFFTVGGGQHYHHPLQQNHSSSVTVEASVFVDPGPIVSSSVVPAGPIRAVSSHNSSGSNVIGIGNNSKTTLPVEDGYQQANQQANLIKSNISNFVMPL
jgi:hypothetical protein